MSFVRWTEPHFKSADVPLVVQRSDRKREKEKALADAYAAAEKRDGLKCRCTGVKLERGGLDVSTRLEHHHLEPRSLKPERIADPTNIVCISAKAHRLEKRGWLVCEGIDANGPLYWHWNDDIAQGRRPLKIKRHNPTLRREEPQ